MTDQGVRRIDVDYLARVEGEGALHVDISGDTIVVGDTRLVFEAFVEGSTPAGSKQPTVTLAEAPAIRRRLDDPRSDHQLRLQAAD